MKIFNSNHGWVNYGFQLGATPAGRFTQSSTDGWTGLPRFARDGIDLERQQVCGIESGMYRKEPAQAFRDQCAAHEQQGQMRFHAFPRC